MISKRIVNVGKTLMLLCCFGLITTYATAKKAVVINNQSQNNLQKDTVAFEKIKKMYAEFVKLIEDGIADEEITKFFNTHFDVEKITERFTGSKTANAQLTEALISYFKFLLSGQIIQQVKDYSLEDDFLQASKKTVINMMCKLKNSSNGVIDMSVTLLKNSQKVLELAFMKSVYLIRGAKNIVDMYCQEKAINYRGAKTTERAKICSDALNDYIKKQTEGQQN